MAVYVVAMLWMAVTQDAAQAQERAVLLHAQGLALAQDNDRAAALEALRSAHQLAPQDRDITFDLARVALESKSPQLTADTVDFMSSPATTADAKVLRAYILAITDTEAARRELEGALRLRPDHPEGLLARTMLEGLGAPPPPPQAPEPRIWSARVRLFGEADTNVDLLPQSIPSHHQGWRLGVQGSGSVSPVTQDKLRWDIAADLRGAFHLNDRPDLALYDTAGGSAWTTLTWLPGPVVWATDIVGTLIYAGERAPFFMWDVYLQSQARLPLGNFAVGLYGLVGDRAFGLDNIAGSSNDRSGGHYEAGVLGEGHWGTLLASLRSGLLIEQAFGKEQQVLGNRSVALVRWAPAPVSLTALLAYEYRNYRSSSIKRVDNLLEPSFLAAYAINDTFQIVGTYLYVHNASVGPYTYDRHLVMLGAEARW